MSFTNPKTLILLDNLINLISSKINSEKNIWIFGYGSLIQTESRNRSYKPSKVYPARINYYKRIWNRKTSSLNDPQPRLGIINSDCKNDTVNGVIFQVTKNGLNSIDKRELKWQYIRSEINIQYCNIINNEKYGLILNNKNDIIYGYELPILKDLHKHSIKRPNYQVYIDTCILGCFEFGINFADEFIKTTYDWRYKWDIDRNIHQSKRFNANADFVATQNECKKIDEFLKERLIKYHNICPEHLKD